MTASADALSIDRSMWRKLEAYGALFAPWIAGRAGIGKERVGPGQIAASMDVTERYGTGPALAWLLQSLSPSTEVRAYANLTLHYGRDKASRRRADILQLASAMNAIGVAPLLLKGSAAQVGGIYPDPGYRLMADMDLLVPAERFAECERAAEEIGFKLIMPIGHHHANQQYHQGRSALLELHRGVTRWHGRSNLPATQLLETATPVEIDGSRLLLPDWTLHAVLVIVHAFVWDECCRKAHVPLKAMLDLAALRVAGVASWSGVQQHLTNMGERQALVHVEVLFRHLFGQPLTGVPVFEARRRLILLWYRLGTGYPVVGRLGLALSLIRRRGVIAVQEPVRLRKLFTVGFYTRLASAVRHAFHRDTPVV